MRRQRMMTTVKAERRHMRHDAAAKWLAEHDTEHDRPPKPSPIPSEADVGVMGFGLGKLADPLHEGERFPEIVESTCALDAAGFIAQLPIRSLALETQGFITRKRRNAAATRRAGFLREGLGRVAGSNRTNKCNGAVSDRSPRTRCRASR